MPDPLDFGIDNKDTFSESLGDLLGVGQPFSEISLSKIDVDPDQPRKSYNETSINELAESIVAEGVIQPIGVRVHPDSKDRFMVVYGERRYKASLEAGLETIPCLVAPKQELAKVRARQLIENLHREDLDIIDECLSVKGIFSTMLSQQDVAMSLGKSKSWVSRRMAIANSPAELLRFFDHERQLCSDALAMYNLATLAEKKFDLAAECIEEAKANSSFTRTLVAKYTAKLTAENDPTIEEDEEESNSIVQTTAPESELRTPGKEEGSEVEFNQSENGQDSVTQGQAGLDESLGDDQDTEQGGGESLDVKPKLTGQKLYIANLLAEVDSGALPVDLFVTKIRLSL